jgi:4-hydroxy-3-polyprenylbenzoate decarboxylase
VKGCCKKYSKRGIDLGKERLVIGISGASGAPIAVELLKEIKNTWMESHLIITPGGEKTILQETDLTPQQVCDLADAAYDCADIGGGPAGGSFKTIGMVVVPCSMKTVAGILNGYSDNLLLRAADVTLKERRKLVLVTRECPLSPIHLHNMLELSKLGATILPPMLSYYNRPQSIEDATAHIVGKTLDIFGFESARFRRWEGMERRSE